MDQPVKTAKPPEILAKPISPPSVPKPESANLVYSEKTKHPLTPFQLFLALLSLYLFISGVYVLWSSLTGS